MLSRNHDLVLSRYRLSSRTLRAKTKQPFRNCDVHRSFGGFYRCRTAANYRLVCGRYKNESAGFFVYYVPIRQTSLLKNGLSLLDERNLRRDIGDFATI